jgi:hypothetical protein
MAIAAQDFTAIDAALADAAADAAAVSALRKLAPGLHVTRCDATDVQDETPFRAYAKCNLYLLDGRDHCVKVTDDPAAATGLVLAPKGNG